jgi:hypothetical protein
MATDFKDEPPRFDPVVERVFILTDIKEIASKFVGEAAVHIVDTEMADITVLAGTIAPSESSTAVQYGGTHTRLRILDSLDRGSRIAQLSFGYGFGDGIPQTYDLNEIPDRSPLLSPDTARADSFARFKLGLTTFTRQQSEEALRALLASPQQLTPDAIVDSLPRK